MSDLVQKPADRLPNNVHQLLNKVFFCLFQTFIYVHKNVSLLDTRESLLGYNKTRAPPGTEFPRKNYELTSEEVFTNFWEDLQIISMGSNMGFKSGMYKKVQVGNDQEKVQSERNSHSKNQGGKN